MGIQDKISAIEARMQEIQGRFGTQNLAAPTPAAMAGQASFQTVMGNTLGDQMGTSPLPGGMRLPGGGLPTLPGMFPGMMTSTGTLPTPGGNAAEFETFIQEASEKWGVDKNLIKAVIQQESAFNPQARSNCGALGLMQLMPETAKSLGVQNPLDARDNILGGTRYLKGLLDRFHGDTRLALAAYNAGAGSVQKYGGVPPFAETQNYVQRIMAHYASMKG